jgi:hypothetical protein
VVEKSGLVSTTLPMKKISLLIALLFFIGALPAHAATQGTWSFDSSNVITDISSSTASGNFAFLATSTDGTGISNCGGTSGSGNIHSVDFIGFSLTGAGGLGSGSCTTPGTYYFYIGSGSFYWVLNWNGTSASPINTGDGRTDTHVVRINSPALYAVASSSFAVNFDIYGNSESPPIGYQMQFVNQLTRATYTRNSWLVDSGYNSGDYDAVFNVATSTSLPADGTYSLTITLWSGGNGGPGPDPAGTTYSYFTPGANTAFSVNVQDNVQTVEFGGAVQQTFASTSCSVNFLGSFNLQDCMGYLLTPSTASGSPMSNLKSLTLAHSAPFAYAYQVGDIRNAMLTATNTASTTIGVPIKWLGSTTTLTFLSAGMIQAVPYTPWIKGTLSALMLLMTAMLVYRKVIASHNTNTHAS